MQGSGFWLQKTNSFILSFKKASPLTPQHRVLLMNDKKGHNGTFICTNNPEIESDRTKMDCVTGNKGFDAISFKTQENGNIAPI